MSKFAGIALAAALIAWFFTASATVQAMFGPEPGLDFPFPYTFTARDCLPSGRECSDIRFYAPLEAK